MTGDEVKMAKWSADSEVAAWMTRHGINTTTALYAYYESRIHDLARTHNRTVMNWVEVFDLFGDVLDPQTIVTTQFHAYYRC